MLHQLSGLSSPPLPSTPLTVVSPGRRDHDLAALRAVLRGDSLGAPANRSAVVVLDRCGRMVYRQTLQQSDTDLRSLEAAILSAHLDEPCGPCHLPPQEEPSPGRLSQIPDRITSQRKMSGIANAYGSSSVANNPTEPGRDDTAVEETADEPEEETVSETTTRKPERKNKKKNKMKKGKHEKQRKRKRVEEAVTSTSKPTEAGCDRECDAGDCECDDAIERLIAASETANEIVRSEESTREPFAPGSMITVREKRKRRKQRKDGKRARAELAREIDEGIEMVREEEELVEYPDAIGDDDNVLEAIEKAVGEVRASEIRRGSENGLSGEDGGVAFAMEDDRVLVTDDRVLATDDRVLATDDRVLATDDRFLVTDDRVLAMDRVAVPDETVYQREQEREEMSREELTEKDAGEKKRRKKSKDASKKGKKTKAGEGGGMDRRVEQIREEERNVEDRWVGSYETDSQKYVLPWPEQEMDSDTVAEREMDGGRSAEREMDGRRFAEREMDGRRFAEREMDPGRFAEREMDGRRFAEREMDGGRSAERETDGGRFAEREMDGRRFAERETDGGRFAERETESDPQYATWREATVAPTEHDSKSSDGDSSDRISRVAVYESQGDDSTSDKVEQLHSKVKPWGKGKHY